MGQIFDKLTTPNSAMVDPGGQATAIGTPNQMMLKAGQQLKDTQNANAASDIAGNPQMPAPVSHLGTPSFSQAATAGAMPGSTNATSPGLNKAGKLAAILTGGLQGAMAGRAASEQAVIQSGGHRSGGAGIGFEAGVAAPWQRAGMQAQLAHQQAQTELLRSQSQMVQGPDGTPIPIALAKVLFPAQTRAGAQENVQQQKGAQGQALQGLKNEGGLEKQSLANTGKTDVAKIQQGAALPVDETVANLAGIPEMAGQSVGKATWDNINKLLAAKGYKNTDLGQEGLWLTDKGGNKIKRIGDSPSISKALAYTQNRPVQVADEANPGNTKYETAGQAVKEGAAGPQSASVQVPRRAALGQIPTKVGDQKVAFNTALQHADLLAQVATALKNGDQRTIAGLKNKFKTEFGSADLNNFNVVANAYNNEINKMLGGGNATIEDLKTSGSTMPSNANLDTLLSAIGNYKKLAQSKMDVLNKQVGSAVNQSQRKGSTPTAGVTHVWTPQGLQPAGQ